MRLGAAATRSRCAPRLERGAERFGGFLRRAERQPLRLEVGVLDRERQNLVVEPPVFAKRVGERIERASCRR